MFYRFLSWPFSSLERGLGANHVTKRTHEDAVSSVKNADECATVE